MSEDIFNKYDSINNYAIRVLAWNCDNVSKDIILSNIIGDGEDFWLLCILRHLHTYKDVNIYFKENWLNYLYFKYVKKFKFLKYKKNCFGFEVDAIKFTKEMAESFNENISILTKIYKQYWEE